jgi:hypothetical protein
MPCYRISFLSNSLVGENWPRKHVAQLPYQCLHRRRRMIKSGEYCSHIRSKVSLPTATDDQIWWAPCLQAHLFFEVLFAFDQPIEDSLVAELWFFNGLDDGDDVEWLMISFFHDVLWSVVTGWLVFVFYSFVYAIVFQNWGLPKGVLGGELDWSACLWFTTLHTVEFQKRELPQEGLIRELKGMMIGLFWFGYATSVFSIYHVLHVTRV